MICQGGKVMRELFIAIGIGSWLIGTSMVSYYKLKKEFKEIRGKLKN